MFEAGNLLFMQSIGTSEVLERRKKVADNITIWIPANAYSKTSGSITVYI